ncbi:MAG: HDOD domain-containing protein [Zoogloeaceae bacterium]|jgi:HD-like signal output (HDOD) protein|nr:HDOD domain-containing protein [Zoogloeaceae bacterium]
MIEQALATVEEWVSYFGAQELPVLRHTRRQLEEAREHMDKVSGKLIARIVLQDPLMAVRVLSYIQPLTGRRLHHDVATIAGAIMMLGVEPFFQRFENLPTIEDRLKDAPPHALLGTIQVIRRAQQAAHYAHKWAVWRVDVDVEEVTLAALLHDLAEILLYAFAPKLALAIRDAQLADPRLRSVNVQEAVLGFPLLSIQIALCQAWKLPPLLLALIDDAHAEHPRVRNVVLAVSLARHLAHGWKDAALPDDLKGIAQLLNLSEAALGERLHLALPANEQQETQQSQQNAQTR